MENNERLKICQKLGNYAILNPEAMTSLICIIADEISLTELNRIQMKFFAEMKYIHQRTNIRN